MRFFVKRSHVIYLIMDAEQARFIELITQDADLSDDEVREMRRLTKHDSRQHVQGMAAIRTSLDNIMAIRRFDKASANLINTTNRLTKWVLGLTILGVSFAAGSLWLSWLALQKR